MNRPSWGPRRSARCFPRSRAILRRPGRAARGAAFFVLFAISATAGPCGALSPDDLLILANERTPEGVAVARFYMERRAVPADRLLAVPMPAGETCSRAEYEHRIAEPVRRFLERLPSDRPVRCIVTVHGVPLRVAAPPAAGPDADRLRALDDEIRRLRAALETNGEGEDVRRRLGDLERQRHDLNRRSDGEASVDAELALVRRERYPVAGWLRNPLYPSFRGRRNAVAPEELLRVSRLDGPTPELIRRRIEETLAAERSGLAGVAYLDARWPEGEAGGDAYRRFDGRIHRLARMLRRRGWPVELERTSALFGPGSAPRTALYCGWYQLARYEDAFDWVPGAVGYHVASGECATLRFGGRTPWCLGMLADGAAVVVGPVGEPYLAAFPPPDLFFRRLLDGRVALADAFLESLPYLSWKMVLVGDPLYRPFAREARTGASDRAAESGGALSPPSPSRP